MLGQNWSYEPFGLTSFEVLDPKGLTIKYQRAKCETLARKNKVIEQLRHERKYLHQKKLAVVSKDKYERTTK